uniref:Uncharacterized protein n=1 Tax=Cannabis sativa TaxID=3483 RepID=A0A803NJF5_CANSA
MADQGEQPSSRLAGLHHTLSQSIVPMGYIRLPLITIGVTPTTRTLMVQFVIINVPSTFNTMVGRPALYNLKAVTSIYYLYLKFPTRHIGCLKGDQQFSRHYYNLVLSKAKKEKMPVRSSEEGPNKG